MFKKVTSIIAAVLAALMAIGIGSAAIAQSAGTTTPSTTASTTPSTLPGSGDAETVMYEVANAGTVTVASDGATLSIVDAAATDDWSIEVEVATGREVEADFRNGLRRIQFNAELEDGQIRVRVRERLEDGGASTNTSTTVLTTAPSTTSTSLPSAGDTSMNAMAYQAGDGGTVTIAHEGSQLTIVTVDPADGWSTEIEVASGREVEVDFRNGLRRVQFNAELEDGEVRVRVRDRVTDDSLDDDNDNSGHDNNDDNSGHDNNDDNSGHDNNDDN